MPFELKIKDNLIIFDDWKSEDPKFMWYRELLNNEVQINPFDGSGYTGIVLLQFNSLWTIRFVSPECFQPAVDIFRKLCPKKKKYSNASEAMEDIDRFLHRINLLKVFI